MPRPASALISLPLTLALLFPARLFAAGASPAVVVSPLVGAPNEEARLSIVKALRVSGRVVVIEPASVDRYLRDRQRMEENPRANDEASAKLKAGEAAYGRLEVAKAVELLSKAKALFRSNLTAPGAFEGLRAAQFHLAMAYLAQGGAAKAREELIEVIVIDPERKRRKLPAKLYSPKIRELYEQVRREVEKKPQGNLEIASDPPGALVFVDGKSLGAAPVHATSLPAGEHFIRLEAEGRESMFTSKYVVGGDDRFDVQLKSAQEVDPLKLFGTVGGASEIAHARAAFLDDMGVSLGGDIFLFLSPGPATVSAQFYDQRSQEVSPVESAGDPAKLISKLLSHLDNNGYVTTRQPETVEAPLPPETVRLPENLKPQAEGTIEEQSNRPLATANEPGDQKYWYENPWLWAGIGGGLLLLGGSLLLFTDVAKQDSNSNVTVTLP